MRSTTVTSAVSPTSTVQPRQHLTPVFLEMSHKLSSLRDDQPKNSNSEGCPSSPLTLSETGIAEILLLSTDVKFSRPSPVPGPRLKKGSHGLRQLQKAVGWVLSFPAAPFPPHHFHYGTRPR